MMKNKQSQLIQPNFDTVSILPILTFDLGQV